MDCRHYITDLPERKSGQHLQREERGAIQALKRQGLSNRAIAREWGCSPPTIGIELRRGTPHRKSSKGRAPGYSAKHGEAVYRSNRLRSRNPRGNKKNFGKSIDLRPEIASQRTEEGHWEGDTVVGKRAGKDAVVFSLLEKKTESHLAFLIPGKTSEAVMAAMQMLKEEYGDRFAQVFKTITVDNGAEFADFAQCESWGTEVFFAHPYTSWERPQNERHNGLFRAFVPKGASMQNYSAEYILSAADELNARPRKKLGYATPEELFDSFLDRVYAVDSKPA